MLGGSNRKKGEIMIGKVRVVPEGRDGCYLVEKSDLKTFIKDQRLETIHNFVGGGMMMIGADHSVQSVMDDIDTADRQALLTGQAKRGNLGHALALVIGEKLEMFDIGDLTEDDLLVGEAPTINKGDIV